MNVKTSIGLIGLILLLASCGGGDSAANGGSQAAVPQIAAPNNGDWRETVTMTERGGFLMGNPDAPVKLLEYASITCPHCGEFAEQGAATLRDRYVRSGQVSWEYRPYMIFPSDPAIFMLLRCQGAQSFFPLSEALYADQRNWETRLQSMSQEQQQALQTMSPQQQASTLLGVTQLDQFFRQRGMPEARITQCINDTANLNALGEITRRATAEDNVTGTPTFFINGTRQDAGDWAGLEPRIRSAIGL